MSSSAAAAGDQRRTFWCHECDMSVTLLISSPSFICPHCQRDFLELMDSTSTTHPDLDPSLQPSPPTTDDNYLLDSPYLHRLIQHLTDLNDSDRQFHPNATSKSSIESMPTIKISSSLLDEDPLLLCAVCKDQFLVGVEAKQLPCKHLYHSDCIIPWLSSHNSCPLCRFRLPTESNETGRRRRRRSRMGLLRFGDLMEDEDWLGFGSTLRQIARRNRLVVPVTEEGGDMDSMSPTQMGEAEPEMGFAGRTSSVETVSSWPVRGEAALSGGGGEGEIGVSVSEDGDAVMSEIRILPPSRPADLR